MKYDPEKLLFAVDLAGTLLFAIEGATAAISGNLDVLGLMVLAFATALGGGIIRDLLIGPVPPNSLRDWLTQRWYLRARPSFSSCIVSFEVFPMKS